MITANRPVKGIRGLTLIELLVAVLILGILMSIAAPLYLAAVADAERKTCRSNLQTIGNAVHSARVRLRMPYPAAGTPVDLNMAPDLQTVPKCPNGGTYTIEIGMGNAPFNVKCSIALHGEHRYGADSE